MATVNNTITLTSNDLTSDAISLVVLNTLAGATQGGITRVKLATNVVANATVLATAEQYPAGSKVFLHNPSTTTDGTERINVSLDETNKQIVLKGGDWALFPWNGAGIAAPKDIEAWGETAAGQVLEYGVFGV